MYLLTPSSINQASTNLCGIAAACKIAAEMDPVNFAENAISLYTTGKINSKNSLYTDIAPSENIRNSTPSNGLPAATYILMTSIRDAGNYLLSYTPTDDDKSTYPGLRGFNYPDDVINFVTNFHNISNTSPFGSTFFAKKGTTGIHDELVAGHAVVGRFDWDQLTTNKPAAEWYQAKLGNHYIQITSIAESNGQITISYWSWGENHDASNNQSITTSKENFNKALKGYSTFSQ